MPRTTTYNPPPTDSVAESPIDPPSELIGDAAADAPVAGPRPHENAPAPAASGASAERERLEDRVKTLSERVAALGARVSAYVPSRLTRAAGQRRTDAINAFNVLRDAHERELAQIDEETDRARTLDAREQGEVNDVATECSRARRDLAIAEEALGRVNRAAGAGS